MSEGSLFSVLSGDARWSVVHSDCLDVLREMPDECVDAIVTDAPYGLSKITEADAREALACWLRGEPYLTSSRGFMGRTWDRFVPGPEVWSECCRVLRPGGHLLTFAGTRTEDLMGIALRLGGLERIDTIEWLYASGFPKSVNLERAVAMEQCTMTGRHFASTLPRGSKRLDGDHLCPETEASRRWKGYGSALKPAHEPILVARKPLRGTYAENVLEHGTAMSIDGCRVAHAGAADLEQHAAGVAAIKSRGGSMDDSWKNTSDLSGASDVTSAGRWPPNVAISHAPGCRRTGTRGVAANPTWDTPNRATEPSAFTGDAVSPVRHGRAGQASAERRYDEAGSTSFAPLPGDRRDVEDVEVWECVDGCPAKALGEMRGESTSPPVGSVCNFTRQASSHTVSTGAACLPNGHGDSGTATRFFPQFADDSEESCDFVDNAIMSSRRAAKPTCSAETDARRSSGVERPGRADESSTHARDAESCSSSTGVTRGSTARESAPLPRPQPRAQTAPSAEPGAVNQETPSARSDAPTSEGREVSESRWRTRGHGEANTTGEGLPGNGTTTQRIQSSGNGRSLSQRQEGHILMCSHARSVALQKESATTMTTTSLGKSDGFAGAATCATTPGNSEDGAPDCVTFRYQSKPSRSEKEAGLQHFRRRTGAEATASEEEQQRLESPRTGAGRNGGVRNCHPTSKSVDLLRWLTRLVARPGQVVFNPFAGGGSEGVAAVLEGCRWIGVEINDSDDEPFVSIARARLLHLEGGEFIPRESLRAPVKERPAQATLFGGTP